MVSLLGSTVDLVSLVYLFFFNYLIRTEGGVALERNLEFVEFQVEF